MLKVLSAVSLPLIATGALAVSTPRPAFAAPVLNGVDAGAYHTCAVVSGAVYCWGRNVDGRIGDGGNSPRTAAVPVDTGGVLAGLRMTRLSSGGTNTCALSSAGRAYCWGAGSSGQLGDGDTVRRTSPVAVDTGGVLSGVRLTRISAGWLHACALSATGRAYCWGKGSGGRLGDGATVSRTSPVPVHMGGVPLVEISAGRGHTCAVSPVGGVYCWGAGSSGQLGNGRTGRAPVPAPVDPGGALSGVTITQIAAGADHTCALSSSGAAYCWGRNTSGQLGDGDTINRASPVAVDTSGALSGVTITQIAAGADHTCALSSSGAVYCWGRNTSGQLGDGETINRASPIAVDTGAALPGVPLRGITAGNNHSCAASATVVYCWGLNSSGQLGDGSTTDRTGPVPAEVRTPPGRPIAVTATAGDGRARVSWRAPANGTVRGYRVTASPGALTCTSSTTSCRVIGLANGTSYTFTVVAAGPDGTSVASAASDPVTPFARPGAPTGVAVTAGDQRATASWSAPAEGGTGGVTGYIVRATPGGAACRTTRTSCRVIGLTNGTKYTFTVIARNAYGRSAPSIRSNPTAPLAAPGASAPLKAPVKPPLKAPLKAKANHSKLTPLPAPAAPVRIAPTAEATGHQDPVIPFMPDEYDATPLLAGSETAAPAAVPSTPPDVPSRVVPADPAPAGTTAAGRPAAPPAQVAAVVLGMGLLVFAGTAGVAYRGRRRAN